MALKRRCFLFCNVDDDDDDDEMLSVGKMYVY